ncbi:MAG: beta-galactosidase [Firmicutes bacterium]|nr:beta-galactosidase [Bacillota bacterium]
MTELPFRQIHLDFHTSEHIPLVGAEFDAEEFARTLDEARVNSITCFARCHHGLMYYNSKRFPERIHPNLVNRNLLLEQIEACHKHGIRVPIYTTIQWDYYTAVRHPEWRVIGPDGQLSGTKPYEAGFYQDLCVNTPYRDFIWAHVEEMLEMLPVDGFFFDIVKPYDCSCRYCQQGMKEAGLDPTKEADRLAYNKLVLDKFRLELSEFVRERNPDATIFYNAGHIGPFVRESKDAYSHFELESLPSGGWGYMHFPLTARYARNLGLDCVSHTGKFHTSWGDFHSFKNKAALEFECFRMLALNCKCEIGDQLHPSGKIDKYVYELIGSVYSQVEKKEPWCRGAKAVSEIGLLTTEEFTGERVPVATAGAVQMLQEAGHQFEVLDTRSSFDAYRLLILPDGVRLTEAAAAKLDEYVAAGGKLIVTGLSGLNPEGTESALKSLGVRLKDNPQLADDGLPVGGRQVGDFLQYVDYILPREAIGKGLPPTEHAMYIKAVEIEAAPDAEVLADVVASYFDRTWEHFCSHRQTPSSGKVVQPAVVRNGNTIYFAHPIFTLYHKNAPRWCKQLLLNAIELLIGQPLLSHNGPTTVFATVNEQPDANRWVVHLLHYIPERRSQEIDIIEDVIPLYNLEVAVKVPAEVKSVTCVPEMRPLEFELLDGTLRFTLDKVHGHQMIEIAFA